MTPNGCPLCGTQGHSCGRPFTGTPVDLPARTENAMGGPVQRYRVSVNGTETVLKLNAEDAERYEDAVPVDSAPATEPDSAEDEKAVTPQNKSRSASNKGGRGGGARNS